MTIHKRVESWTVLDVEDKVEYHGWPVPAKKEGVRLSEACRAIQQFTDPPKPIGSDQPEAQRVNPKPMVSRIRVYLLKKSTIRIG